MRAATLISINPIYHCFVLSFCIFHKEEYLAQAVPSVQRLKFKWWGHDAAILHTMDIKWETIDFAFLKHVPTKEAFIVDLNTLLGEGPFTLIAAVIDKQKLLDQVALPDNPYNIALKYFMETAYEYLESIGQHQAQTSIIVEERGTKENRELELEFLRISGGASVWGELPNFNFRLCSKKANASGLQFADLVSTPIGRKLLKPDQSNRAYEIIERKFLRSPAGNIERGRKLIP